MGIGPSELLIIGGVLTVAAVTVYILWLGISALRKYLKS